MVAVLISIKPKWCQKIAEGLKTIEVRKSKPKIQVPFKCYIYCTQGFGKNTFNVPIPFGRIRDDYIETGSMVSLNCPIGNGKVIGEFICDHVYQCTTANHLDGTDISIEEVAKKSCLSLIELEQYELSAEPKENCIYKIGLYGWRISDLKIYDKPLELSKFVGLRNTKFGYEPGSIKNAPQSWRYVETQKKSDTPADQS